MMTMPNERRHAVEFHRIHAAEQGMYFICVFDGKRVEIVLDEEPDEKDH